MNKERYYLLTGAAGFLGTNICMQLEPGSRVEMKVMRKSQDEYKEMTFQMEAQEVK